MALDDDEILYHNKRPTRHKKSGSLLAAVNNVSVFAWYLSHTLASLSFTMIHLGGVLADASVRGRY